MIRKIITIAATALAIGTLTVTPPVAEAAGVNVSATVASALAITSTSPNVSTTSWTGASTAQVPFTVTVSGNQAYTNNSYYFTFTGGHSGFNLEGTAYPNLYVAYTVTGTGSDTETYISGTAGTIYYPSPGVGTGTTSSFNVNLPGTGVVTADTYADTLTVTLNT